jgi:hypothetical protein
MRVLGQLKAATSLQLANDKYLTARRARSEVSISDRQDCYGAEVSCLDRMIQSITPSANIVRMDIERPKRTNQGSQQEPENENIKKAVREVEQKPRS